MANKDNKMLNSRREFIKNASLITAIIASSGVQSLSGSDLYELRKNVKLRFIIASDAHYGQLKTPFDEMIETFVQKANYFHKNQKCDFCVLNGDLIHDEAHLMVKAKTKFDKLEMPTYVTKGNHDKITDLDWLNIWKIPVNFSFKKAKNAFILATTSDEEGTYLSPNLEWMKTALEKHKKAKNVFLFIHIPQIKWTANAIDTPEFLELVSTYPNVKAIFHGHEHDQDNILYYENIPLIFDSHIGGSWGTDYKGFRVVEVLKDDSIVTFMMNPDIAIHNFTL